MRRIKNYILLILVFAAIFWFATKSKKEKIAYTKIDNGFWQIWLMEINNSAGKPLTHTKTDKSFLDWSTDGKKIAYTTGEGELRVIDLKTKKDFGVALNITAFEPKWSKGADKILFSSPQDVFHDDIDIWSLNLDGSNLTKITRRPWAQTNPEWLPGEQEILFVDSHKIMGEEICRFSLISKDSALVTQDRFNDIQPVYLANKNKIAYASNRSGDYDIWIMDSSGRNAKNLTQNPSHDILPKASKDNRKIYFLSDRTGYFQIFSIDLKTNKLRQLTFDNADKKDFTVYAN